MKTRLRLFTAFVFSSTALAGPQTAEMNGPPPAQASGAATSPSAAGFPRKSPHVKQLMTQEQYESAGISKLTPGELSALDEWLADYVATVAEATEKAVKQVEPKAVAIRPMLSTPDVVESSIDGEFQGWDGETIFKLANGQIWQQAEYDYTYEYAYGPDVTIYKTNGGYRMKVEDVADTILVTRIK